MNAQANLSSLWTRNLCTSMDSKSGSDTTDRNENDILMKKNQVTLKQTWMAEIRFNVLMRTCNPYLTRNQ